MKRYKIKILILIISMLFNLTVVKASNDIADSSENWKDWQKEEYWEWHTRKTTDDKAYNGTHIVIQNDFIDFYGYWKTSYKDFLYKKYNNAGKKYLNL